MGTTATQQPRTCCRIKLDRFIAIMTGTQVLRALWEIWGCFDNEWPPLINVLILPTIYISCTLAILLTVVSVCATWSVYKAHMRSLNIYWWIYYALTVLAFLNSCVNMSIMCLGKGRFIAGCLDSESIQVSAEHCRDCQVMLPTCTRAWESATVWAAVGAMVTLTINIIFAYALYRVKSTRRTAPASIPQHRSHAPPSYHSASRTVNKTSMDEEGFQVIELK
ncbi:hypothetical protein BCR43DRAFT_543204 [Syncephalastrum racemosum]|uniref:MARVEL domain-containing protein n=1 Tax=Syncephalastrum racemosum TaxID=13706 RepID=A0A1X2HHC0_SYNRA|nr:hypothetical protein BCR43DRAFT_543204 [Syncephalastrum racemosum]